MRRKGRPKKQKSIKVIKVPGKRGRPRKKEIVEGEPPVKRAKRGRPKSVVKVEDEGSDTYDDPLELEAEGGAQGASQSSTGNTSTEEYFSEGLHMSTMQVRALSSLISCRDCGEEVVLGVRPTTKGMISEFTVTCKVCGSQKSTNTPNLIRERKRKREKKGVILQKTENINYAHVAAFLDNGLGYSGLRHYCKYFNARCLNEATFIVYAKQVISDVVAETEDFLQQNARIVRKAFESQFQSDYIIDLTVGYTTTYHQWGSDFCLVAGAVIELQTGLVLDYDVGNMYCHVCKINAKKIVSMTPTEMTEWFNKHQDTCEIREWCDEIDQDSEEGIKEIDPKYLEAFIAKKIWARSVEKFGFRYTTLIHESDERIHNELLKAAPYGDIPVLIDTITNCYSRRKSEHARTSFQNKLKAKCPRERVQTKDRIMYVYSMSIPEYNKFAIGSNIKLRELVRRMEIEEEEYATEISLQAEEIQSAIQEQERADDEDKKGPSKEVGDAFEIHVEDDNSQTGIEVIQEEDSNEVEEDVDTEDAEEGEEGMEDEEGDEVEDEEQEEEEEEVDVEEDEIVTSQDIEVFDEEEEEEEMEDDDTLFVDKKRTADHITKKIVNPTVLNVDKVSIKNEKESPEKMTKTPEIDAPKKVVTSEKKVLLLSDKNKNMDKFSSSKEGSTKISAEESIATVIDANKNTSLDEQSKAATSLKGKKNGPILEERKITQIQEKKSQVAEQKKDINLEGKKQVPAGEEKKMIQLDEKKKLQHLEEQKKIKLSEKKQISTDEEKLSRLEERKKVVLQLDEKKKVVHLLEEKKKTAQIEEGKKVIQLEEKKKGISNLEERKKTQPLEERKKVLPVMEEKKKVPLPLEEKRKLYEGDKRPAVMTVIKEKVNLEAKKTVNPSDIKKSMSSLDSKKSSDVEVKKNVNIIVMKKPPETKEIVSGDHKINVQLGTGEREVVKIGNQNTHKIDIHYQEPKPGSSSDKEITKFPKKIESPTENGREEDKIKPPTRPQLEVKPFRVDFDED